MGQMSRLTDLGLTMNNGECLEVIKKERGYIEAHIKQMSKDSETTFNQMKDKVRLAEAYDVLIEVFERHLNHDID